LAAFALSDACNSPDLKVGPTLEFAAAMNTPSQSLPMPDGSQPTRKQATKEAVAKYLKAYGLSHVRDTKVGDQYVRGVSGGERRRASLAEVLTASAQIALYDNASRGLDANTALGWAATFCHLAVAEMEQFRSPPARAVRRQRQRRHRQSVPGRKRHLRPV
jgi:ATP-binding cassette subfamily G (WHITE) protein 2 (SNQ2)